MKKMPSSIEKRLSPKKRRSYTVNYKLKVIEVAKLKGNRAAGREYLLDESTIRGWEKKCRQT